MTYVCSVMHYRPAHDSWGWVRIPSDDSLIVTEAVSASVATKREAAEFARQHAGEGLKIAVYDGDRLVAESPLHEGGLVWDEDIPWPW